MVKNTNYVKDVWLSFWLLLNVLEKGYLLEVDVENYYSSSLSKHPGHMQVSLFFRLYCIWPV